MKMVMNGFSLQTKLLMTHIIQQMDLPMVLMELELIQPAILILILTEIMEYILTMVQEISFTG